MYSTDELNRYFNNRDNNKPFSPDELGKRWDCSAKTVTRTEDRGEIRGFSVGRKRFYTVEAVYEYEQKGSGNP